MTCSSEPSRSRTTTTTCWPSTAWSPATSSKESSFQEATGLAARDAEALARTVQLRVLCPGAARLGYRHPLDDVLQVGFLLAASTKDHPKIPNYDIVNILRDPGNTAVFNIGAGLSREEGPLKAALEVVFEPGRSHTWAFADTIISLPSGATLQRRSMPET